MTQPTAQYDDASTVEIVGAAAPGLLARLTAVLNPYPVTEFAFTETPSGTITATISVSGGARGQWHAQRVVARLNRVVGVTAVKLVSS